MGIKGLTKLLADKAPNSMKSLKFDSYAGREIAVDASLCIYQFLIVVGRNGTETLTNEAGEVTSHLFGMFGRTIRLLQAGIKPVYVFDGPPPDQKRKEIEKRYSKREDAAEYLADAIEIGNKEDIEKYSKQTVQVSKQHNDDCKKLLQLMGVPIVQAPSEAEAQCAALCKLDKVYAMASEDMDSLAFGAPRFLRHLMDPVSKKSAVVEFEIERVLAELNLTMDQFIDMCILSGCDYCDSIKGIGGQTALKLIRQHGTLENVIEKINKQRYQLPDDWEFQKARQLFKEPSIVNDADQMNFQWHVPNEEGLLNFLVSENGFRSDRVVKGVEKLRASANKLHVYQREPSFTHVASSSVPIRMKESKVILGSSKTAMKPISCVPLLYAQPGIRHNNNLALSTNYSATVMKPSSRGFSFIP